ncbi:hypothetical protein CQW23_16301 [Capsicum baccatum]|uniref:Protein kinase domain-containing protein n=1 Tax=Capsicum baccatum TaxID=33114 RepID=A0A2G2WAK3_CAPBA|nr:hypothetical protein CQW23_16301 [Capsicum baccatum]
MQEMNIKLFDFGPAPTRLYGKNNDMTIKCHPGREAPDRDISERLCGRLFRGTIGEGSEKRSVIVKTWDFLLPNGKGHVQRPFDFCDQIMFFTNKKLTTDPRLAKLCAICCDIRLAAVYDEKFDENIIVLSDVLLNDDFGWYNRLKVAIQLANLLLSLHEKDSILGSVTASCVMILDKLEVWVCVAPKVKSPNNLAYYCAGYVSPKSDVYVFSMLLITKKEFDYSFFYTKECRKENLVDESFKEVDLQTGSRITNLTYRCTNTEPEERPTMKDVLDVLKEATKMGAKGGNGKEMKMKMGAKGEKQKRDENEAVEVGSRSCPPLGLAR